MCKLCTVELRTGLFLVPEHKCKKRIHFWVIWDFSLFVINFLKTKFRAKLLSMVFIVIHDLASGHYFSLIFYHMTCDQTSNHWSYHSLSCLRIFAYAVPSRWNVLTKHSKNGDLVKEKNVYLGFVRIAAQEVEIQRSSPWIMFGWKESYDQPKQHIKKQRYYFANKGMYSQGYGFSSGHVRMWELDYKESWALKNWCFETVVLEKTFESPLDCKEIQPVLPKGD